MKTLLKVLPIIGLMVLPITVQAEDAPAAAAEKQSQQEAISPPIVSGAPAPMPMPSGQMMPGMPGGMMMGGGAPQPMMCSEMPCCKEMMTSKEDLGKMREMIGQMQLQISEMQKMMAEQAEKK